MESNLLRVFIVVAKHKSVSQAALELKCAQSNVTSRIKQLEKNIGDKLFFRVSKGVKLTKIGEKLYPNALEIIKKMDDTIALMQNVNKNDKLRIASTQANAPIRLVPFISKIKSDFPSKKIELYTNTSWNIIDSLLAYDIDIGFICGKLEHKDIFILKEFEEELYIIKAKDKEIQNSVFTYIDNCIYYTYYVSKLRSEGNNDFESVIIENYETILACIELGMGSAVLPYNIIKKYNYENKLQLTKIQKNKTNFSTCLVCRKDNIPDISEYLKKIEI